MPYPYTVNVNQLNSKGERTRFKAGKPFWGAFAILLVLLIITGSILSFRLYEYSQIDQRELSLKSNMDEELDVFAISYRNAEGKVTVEGADGQKVLAPGTDVEYTVRLRNTDSVAIDYTLTPQLEFLSEHRLPIEVRLLDHEDNYIVGDAKTWASLEDLNAVEETATLTKGKTAEYIFQWRWPYEAGNDEYDTLLGNSAVDTVIGVDLRFAVHAEVNTSVEVNGGFMESGMGDVTLVVIFCVLLILAIVLLVVTALKKHAVQKQEVLVAPKPVAKKVEAPKKPTNVRNIFDGVSKIDLHIKFSDDDHK